LGVPAKGATTDIPVIGRVQLSCLVILYGGTVSRIFETELGSPFYVAEQALTYPIQKLIEEKKEREKQGLYM
jgi:hypothetical protein